MPDVLKLCRATEDALNGVVWRDDSRNVCMHIEKVYAEPGEPEGAHIRVWALPERVGAARPPVDQLALTG
jgi:Holliday junction resolvase RusA-like endonuclease